MISALGPEINKVHYKSSYTMPPTAKCDVVEIDAKDGKYIRPLYKLTSAAYEKGHAAYIKEQSGKH